MSHDLAAPDQSRAQDTLRWGGVFGLNLPTQSTQTALSSALRNSLNKGGKQLVNAHWRWPLSWRLALILSPNNIAAPGDLSVTFAITIGSGDAQATVFRTVTLANGTTDSTVDTSLTAIPACDVMITVAGIQTTDSHPIAGPFGVDVGAFVAPETEPHAMLMMLDCLGKMCGGADGSGRREGGWMPAGFYPEPLQYER